MDNLTLHASSDWPTVSDKIETMIKSVSYNHDLYKLHRNIRLMVTALNAGEMYARQTGNAHCVHDKLEEINSTIKLIVNRVLYLKLKQ